MQGGKHSNRQIRPTLGLFWGHFGPIFDEKGSFSYTSHGNNVLRQNNIFCAMAFETWETKFGMVGLNGNMKKVTPGLFSFFRRASVKVKVAEKSLRTVKLRLKSGKKKCTQCFYTINFFTSS